MSIEKTAVFETRNETAATELQQVRAEIKEEKCMKIEFGKLPLQHLEHFKGGEGVFMPRMYTDELGKIMRGCLTPGSTIGLHTHDTSSEIIFFLEGNGHMVYDGVTETVQAGDCHYCPKGHTHTMINDSDADLVFYAVVPEQ